ncbi:MAG: hypothetical protein ACTSRA_02295 [Promethearchaeota archaeon]
MIKLKHSGPKTQIKLSTVALLVLCTVIFASRVSAAISPSQVAYREKLWAPGNYLTYSVVFENALTPSDEPSYIDTVNISAEVTYNVTQVTGDIIDFDEIINNIKINYTYPITENPFVAVYKINSSSEFFKSLDVFRADLIRETGGVLNLSDDFLVANNYSESFTITDRYNFTIYGGRIINQYTFNKSSNSYSIRGNTSVINKIMVSSNITGPISGNQYTYREKLVRFGFFYTAMAFSGQNGTFWADLSQPMERFNDMGLWSGYEGLFAYSMSFKENKTYTIDDFFYDGNTDLRWYSEFGINYLKVGTYENAWFDSETGILLKYETKQTRWDAMINETFYENIKPQILKMSLVESNISLESNAKPEIIPGFPIGVVILATCLGALVLALRSRFRKRAH